MATAAERITALEQRVGTLEAALKATAQPFPVRNVSARWLAHVKYAPKPDGKCATPRCSNMIAAGDEGFYVPKGCGSGHSAGVYCVTCGEIMSPRDKSAVKA